MTLYAPMTLPQAAQAALDVQTACNLVAVTRAFVRAMDAVLANTVGGTAAWNRHPVAQLFAVQIAHLTTGCCLIGDSFDYSKAYAECERLARGTSAAPTQEVSREDHPLP